MDHIRVVREALSTRRASPDSGLLAATPITESPPPQVSLTNVEPRLNMHQYNGFFDSATSTPEKEASIVAEDVVSQSPPTVTNEWSSAVGHAMTGKSGRVIHNLQEDIARLTRECTLHRSRAEEAQRMNEALKQQLQTVMDRLRHSEQAYDMNLAAVDRKDRKIEELKAEMLNEKQRRIHAEADAQRTTQLAIEERNAYHRSLSEAQDTAQQAHSQYETLSQARLRDRREYQFRFNTIRRELGELCAREKERQNQLNRFDVIMEQKNREIATGRDRMERFSRLFEEYKADREHAFEKLVETGNRNDRAICDAISETKDVTDKMKWTMNVQKEFKGAE
ncbi:mother-specific HO expression [Ophidiomyces ophidiicola]|uniref:Mother-specific HO expression n=1 Tax=Ophidiomyces ophidiicola TaxID=1387563 RepID=A0ACB8UTB8_9EURO|nr:mother-specific HO expression [Ophidiomyces ophidiicola]KAI1906842.1 mother-specific HO expression [Ophidiomyces ophidiicola]KAI1939826.1 mother-specific HO expression [Ophidiomyces ophidiicola]KAI1951991.1 mother-specific HO expression [Ophidiomyces ophidiicola]KAI1955514.1 mother-specific HO expression [Ophidiomyces ophidiicola]KAI2005011.1 mother-specific HO expression [Ophidiomyces ophidiicola]